MRRTYLLAALVLASVSALAACAGAEGQETPEPTPTTVALPSETAPPAPTPTATKQPRGGPIATALALGSQVTLTAPTVTPVAAGEVAAEDFVGIFEKAWRIVDENYVRDNFNGVDWEAVRQEYLPKVEAVETQEQFWDLMEDFIRELNDQHSRFVRPDRFASEFDLPSDQEGRPGTGIQIWPGPSREDEVLYAWYVCGVGPAASAGLVRGDVILAVNGQQVVAGEQGIDRSLAYQAVFGDGESDAVTLTVQQGPQAEPKDVVLHLGGAADCDGWRSGLISLEPRIGYVRVPDFGGDSDTNLLRAIQELEQEAPLDGLIVDVRHNPGGNSDRDIAIFTEGIFGKVGPLRKDATQTIYRIRGPVKWNEETPVAVLIDGSSHSAAEYFATAMQQSGRAVLVGMPTAGNTEGITGFSLPDGSLVRLAVMTLQLPDGSTLEGVGVQPDLRVPLGMWGLRQDPDVQLRAAYKALTGQELP